MRPQLVLSLLLLFLGLGSARQETTIWLWGGGTYGPEAEVRLELSLTPGQTGTLSLYRVGNPERVLTLGGPANFRGTRGLELTLQERREVRVPRGQYYREVMFGPLPVGMYLAQLGSGRQRRATLVLVTDLKLVVKSDSDTALAYTANGDGQPRRAQVTLLRGREVYAEGLANDEGLTEFTTALEGSETLVVAARYGDAWAFSENYWNAWAVERAKVYLQTDRPVYRPGQTVQFKGTARSPSGLRPLVRERVELVIHDAEGTELERRGFTTDRYGSFSGELTLTAEPPLGSYSLTAQVRGGSSYGSFEVAAYQKPEYRVTVTPEQTEAVQGDTLNVTVAGEYLFGGPVAGGRVTYAVLRQPYFYWSYRSAYGFYEDVDYAYDYGGEVVERGEGVLNEDGELLLEVPLTETDEDYRVTVQVGVTDEARREITGRADLTAYRAGVVLGVQPERYAYRAGETAHFTVRAADVRGDPASVAFRLETVRYLWDDLSGSRSVRGQTYRGVTDEEGNAVIEVPVDEQGSYGVTVRAEDAAGRETSADGSFWVAGDDRWFWGYEGLSVTPDREEYRVGDLARFVIESPVPDAYALVSLEGQTLADYDLVKLNGSVLTYELPVTKQMTPNGYLSVVIVGNGVTYTQTAGFRVPPEDKFLNVELTADADLYKPGEQGTFDLRVSDASGRGVAAQVTLALVDEAIYLLRPDATPDIRGFFYALRENVVYTQLSEQYYFGDAAATDEVASTDASARAPMTEAVFGQNKAAFAPADVRDSFRDTLLWLPTLTTDAAGRATVQVTFPDNLTEWRLTARAITLTDEVGQNTVAVRTTLPVIAQVAAPRFLIRGDEASVRVVGQNNLDRDLEGRLEFRADGLEVPNPDPVTASFPAGGGTNADFTVRADETGTATLSASARTPAASDTLKLPVPVLPHGIRQELGWADSVSNSVSDGNSNSGSSTWDFTLPATADVGNATGTLFVTPSLAAAVSPALAYLAGYPYGCTEQTMSRFLPSVLAAQAGDLAALPDDVTKNLDDMVAVGLKRLYDFQHGDGGWGFWQYDESSAFISSYVVLGLLGARDAGYNVKPGVLEPALVYLERTARRETDPDLNADGRAYAYYALARAGRDVPTFEAFVGRAKLSPYGLALSVLTLLELGETAQANLYLDDLLTRVTERSRVAYWDGDAPAYAWNDDRIEATAYGLEALARLRPEHPLVGKVVNWLLLERQGARWVSTKDTAAVIKAALVLAGETDEAKSTYNVTVTLNGQRLARTRVAGQARAGLEVPLTELRRGANRLEVNVGGRGTLYLGSSVDFSAEQETFAPDTDDFTVRRRYERLTPVFDEAAGTLRYTRGPLEGTATVGDYVLVTLSIRPHDRFRYVLVNEPLPAGFRVVEDDSAFRVDGVSTRYGPDYYGWNYLYDGREIRDERIDYYFSDLYRPVTFTYLLRAETPGLYSALPTQAWPMYEPEARGTGRDHTLRVVGE